MTEFEKDLRQETDTILVFITLTFCFLGLCTFLFGIDWVLTGILLIVGGGCVLRILFAFYRIGKAFLR